MQDTDDNIKPTDQLTSGQDSLAPAGQSVVSPATAGQSVVSPLQPELVPSLQSESKSTPDHSQEASDEYLAKFDTLSDCNHGLAQIVAGFGSQPDDQQRLYAVMNYVVALQKQNEHLYDLLVEMNNYFGSK